MKIPAPLSSLLMGVFAFTFLQLTVPAKAVFADVEKEKSDVKRSMDQQIADLDEKISEVKQDYKADGDDVNLKIKGYEDKIAEIKRDAAKKMDAVNAKADAENASSDISAGKNSLGTRVSSLTKDFHEWRLDHAISRINQKIADAKSKADGEVDVSKKTELEEKISKLEAKQKAAQDKLSDLKTTQGANWDKIEKELDQSLKEIDHDYDQIQGSRNSRT